MKRCSELSRSRRPPIDTQSDAPKDEDTGEAKVDTNPTSNRAEPTPNKDTKEPITPTIEPITPTILGRSGENKESAATGAGAENRNALDLTGKSHRQLADDANKRKMNRKIVNNNTN